MARVGAVLAGLLVSVGGITVNRFCASGLSAVQIAADRIRAGQAQVMIAAGVESMSLMPMMGNMPSLSPSIFENNMDVGIAYGTGLTSLEGLVRLRTVFAAHDTGDCGHSSQTSDGAGALILASEQTVSQFGLKPLARFVSFASRGVPRRDPVSHGGVCAAAQEPALRHGHHVRVGMGQGAAGNVERV